MISHKDDIEQIREWRYFDVGSASFERHGRQRDVEIIIIELIYFKPLKVTHSYMNLR